MTAIAQNEEPAEPLWQQFQDLFQHESFSPGILIQAGGTFGETDRPQNNGFWLGNARLKISGKLDQGFDYKMQTDFRRSASILDAQVGYQINPNARIQAGSFKAPFSAETLISSSSTDFINRSTVTSALAPSRQIGVSGRLQHGTGNFGVEAGVFNGNGRNFSGNDNNKFLWTSRVELTPEVNNGTIEVGGNVAYSDDGNDSFDLTRFLAGADVRYETSQVLLSAEYIRSRVEFEDAVETPYGIQVTGGYNLVEGRQQVLIRFDHFDPDDSDLPITDYVIFGYNYWPTSAFEFQFNYLLPASSDGFHQVMFNCQIAL